MRAFWSGDIRFGLVTIPVKLYTAVRDLTAQVHHLHKACQTRITMVRRCPHCEEDLGVEDIGKGREVAKNRYALFTKAELAKLEREDETGQGSIEILQCFNLVEFDLTYLEKSYWMGPGSRNRGTYDVLQSVLEEAKKVALARVKLRTRSRLALVRSRDGILSLDMMRSAEELVGAGDLVAQPKTEMNLRDRQLMFRLVGKVSGIFNPTATADRSPRARGPNRVGPGRSARHR